LLKGKIKRYLSACKQGLEAPYSSSIGRYSVN
jgi:hypothetical protein